MCLNNRADLQGRRGDFAEARSAIDDALGYQKKVELELIVTTVKLFSQVNLK